MSHSGNKTVKLLSVAVALSSILLGSFCANQAWAEEKKPTVTLVWEKKMDMEYSPFKQYDYDQIADSFFKAQERILSGQVREQENVIVVVPRQEIRFIDKLGNVVKRIPLMGELGKVGTAYLSPDGKYVGIDFFDSRDETSNFEIRDAAGNLLWQKKLEYGIYDKVLITQGANYVVLFITNNGDTDTPPDTLQFFSKDGTLLKEYNKPEYEMKEIWMDKREKINVRLERGRKSMFYNRFNADGSLIWERDITGFTIDVQISFSGEYYRLSKKEGSNLYDYIFNKEGVLLYKILIPVNSGFSPDADYYFLRVDIEGKFQYTPLSTGVPLLTIDSRGLPGEEKTNTIRTSTGIHPSGQYFLISLVKEKDGAPGWMVILDSTGKKVYQSTFPQGNIKAKFSEDGSYIRVNNNAENKIMLYKLEY